ncbi:CDP-diacylglycerol--serine O-phosphatidyltransferase [Synergistales bacterium]|nr:CDP-diacylglycerol--serine O-phosphatidyltransferase [Synergistales bacterium]
MGFLKMKRLRRGQPLSFRQILPNMVTSGNLLCGMFSIILSVHEHYVPAAWLIFFAVVFDGLDGKVARSLGGASQFGLEYDSLADLVSFGVAPATMTYMASFAFGDDPMYFGGVAAAIVACYFTLCVALRLARFNVAVAHVPGPFQGLPSPAGGLFVASFILADIPSIPVLMIPVLLITGSLMISSLPYSSIKKITGKTADRKRCLLVLTVSVAIFAILKSSAPLVFFSAYILSGALRCNWSEWLLLPDAREPIENTH